MFFFVGGVGPISESGGRTIRCCGGKGGCPQERHLISNLLKLHYVCYAIHIWCKLLKGKRCYGVIINKMLNLKWVLTFTVRDISAPNDIQAPQENATYWDCHLFAGVALEFEDPWCESAALVKFNPRAKARRWLNLELLAAKARRRCAAE